MAGPSPSARGFSGYGASPSLPPQGYGQMQQGMPTSAGGYGRPEQMQPNYGAPQSAGGYGGSHGGSYGGGY